MSIATANDNQTLGSFIETEVRKVFEKSESPRYSFPLSDAIETLFDILNHYLGEAELDAVGHQILQALVSYQKRGDFLYLPDRLEAFLKFIRRLLNSAGPTTPTITQGQERMFLPDVLVALGLVDASSVCERPLALLEGKPKFAWYICRAVRARNEVHRAPIYTAKEKAEIFESICVVMLFAVCERKEQIGLALLAANQRSLLERYRNTFEKWGQRFVEIEGQERHADEFEGIDPLAVEVLDAIPGDQDDSVEAQLESPDSLQNSQTPDQRRGLVLELVRSVPKLVLLGDPGAGKTTTLQYLAWRMASGLLKDPGGEWWLPIYITLKTFASVGALSIEGAIQAETNGVPFKQLAKQRCLFLLDGLNEVPHEHLLAAKHQIQCLLSLGHNVRIVVTCRPGQLPSEFAIPIFDLQPLKDKQILHFFQKHLRDSEKVRRLVSVVKSQPNLWEWARNPFMLAMLVRVFLKNGSLPENRGKLMKAFLGDIMKREQVQGAAPTPLATKSTLLAHLAFETRKLDLLSFERNRACSWIKVRRDEIGGTLDVPNFVDEILNNNILSKTAGELLTFDHELYQEFFCAVALLDMGDRGALFVEEIQSEKRWEEPIILYSGICERRSRLLGSLALSNVHLAAKCLTSAAVDEDSDRKIILLSAQTMAAEAAAPSKVADGLLSLAELGEADAMIIVLKQRGAQDATTRDAIRSFIPKCPPELVVSFLRSASEIPDKFLIKQMLAAIAPDQKEILLRDQREALKDLFLWQSRGGIQTIMESHNSQLLLSFMGPDFRTWLAQSLAKNILARVDHGGDDQWHSMKLLGVTDCELVSHSNRAALFSAALCSRSWSSISAAVAIWTKYPRGQNMEFVFQTIQEDSLKQILRMLRTIRDIDHYRLSLSLANALRSHLSSRLAQNPLLLRTGTGRLKRLASLEIGEVIRNCIVKKQTKFGAFVELGPESSSLYNSEDEIRVSASNNLSFTNRNDALLHLVDAVWDRSAAGMSVPEMDDRIDLVVLEIDDLSGNVLVGLKQMIFALWDNAQAKYPFGKKAVVQILALNSDYAHVELEAGVEGIIPRMEFSRNEDLSPADRFAVGQEIEALVCSANGKTQKFGLSTRLLEPDPWDNVERVYSVGSTVVGKVKKVVDFGVFVRLPQLHLDGLLHINDLTAEPPVKHPSVLIQAGQELEVVILEIDKGAKRIKLGLKERFRNPWGTLAAKYTPGMRVEGTIVDLRPYGAFIEIERGVEGMVRISEMSWKRDISIMDMNWCKGQKVEVIILSVDQSEHKIALSYRHLLPDPWESVPEKFPPGRRVKGPVRNITTFGAFIELDEGVDGMVHVSDISWTRAVSHPSAFLEKGEEIEAIVLSLEKSSRRLALGYKQLTVDPWDRVEFYCQIGTSVKCTVHTVTESGACVSLTQDIQGFIHFMERRGALEEVANTIPQVGQELTARVLSIDKANRVVALTLRTVTTDD